MLDLAYLRENLDEARQRLSSRGFTLDVETFQRLDSERKNLIQETEKLQQLRNATSEDIAQLMKQKVDVTDKRNEMKAVSEKIKDLKTASDRAEEDLFRFASVIPNLPDPDVPIGLKEED